MTACEHQTIIGIELGELTLADIHIEHHSVAKRLIEILTDKGYLRGAAHTARTLKGKEAGSALTEILKYTLRAEH